MKKIKKKLTNTLFFFFNLTLLVSCVNQKDISYFQGELKNAEITGNILETRIQPGDLLSIKVTSLNPEANTFFYFGADKTSPEPNEYLVNSDGKIEMPILGSINIVGLTTKVAKDSIRNRLEKYLESPSVMIRLENFRVTILGEVAKPGMYTIANEKLTLLEALGLAGDLSIYAKRKNVLLIREMGNKREFIRIDLTDPNLFQSPFFYLQSQDVIYIEAGSGRYGASDNFYRTMPIVLSALTIISVIISQIYRP